MSRSKQAAAKSMSMKRYTQRGVPGAMPGLIHIPKGAHPPQIRFLGYGPDASVAYDDCKFSQVKSLRGVSPVTWIDATGLGDAALIEQFGQLFGIHRLALGDLVNIPQRSKAELYQEILFVVIQLPRDVRTGSSPRNGNYVVEQISFFVGNDFVLSWRERPSDCFDAVRARLQVEESVIRRSRPDYLLYALIDAVIDAYFPTLEHVGVKLDELDEELESGLHPGIVSRIHGVRHDVRLLRRVIWPVREMVDSLGREHKWLVGAETSVYLRDCHDHAVQIIETLENYREACSDLRDYHATEVSNRMNEIMKVLTVIATIFIPLSFIAGVYGMNFDSGVSELNMPELKWRWGYPFALGLMMAVAIGQLFFFRWRGWLGGGRSAAAKRAGKQR